MEVTSSSKEVVVLGERSDIGLLTRDRDSLPFIKYNDLMHHPQEKSNADQDGETRKVGYQMSHNQRLSGKQELYDWFDAVDEDSPRDLDFERVSALIKRKRSCPSPSAIPDVNGTFIQGRKRPDSTEEPTGRQAGPIVPTVRSNPSRSKITSNSVESIAPTSLQGRPGVLKQGALFEGYHFYFFPNNAANPVRKLRIRKAVEHGAIREDRWSKAITHIVADKSMTYDQVVKHTKTEEKLESIPDHVKIVNEDFPADCIAYGTVVDSNQIKYQVKGHEIGSRHPAMIERSQNGPPASPPLKPGGRDVQTEQPQTPSQNTVVSAHSGRTPETTSTYCHVNSDPRKTSQNVADRRSDLEEAIAEAKQAQHLVLEDSGESDNSDVEGATITNVPRWQTKFQCMKSNAADVKDGPNAATIAVLQQMADHYNKINDTWRPIAYRKAITVLRQQTKKICTADEAEKLPTIGRRLAEKIEEIVCTNRLRRLDNAKDEPTDQALQLFLGVYGIGFQHGMRLVAQGYRTLEDLRSKAALTDNQKIGLEHYDDFASRIPRQEVQMHADVVVRAARKINRDVRVYTMGSYRRGADTSGDIDLVVTHPDWSPADLRGMLGKALVPLLFKQDFLKCSLASTSRDGGSKWHGASCIPGSSTWRRIDLLLVPSTELGAALIYFTGNDIFNRSMRLLASKKGMRLNQRGLYQDVMRGRGRERITEGTLLEGRDEKRIFQLLGVPWREPNERIC